MAILRRDITVKKLSGIGLAALLLTVSTSGSAWWGGNNGCGNNGWGNNGWGNSGWNDWPVWSPMYWAEEMFDDNDYYGPYNYGGYGPNNYGGYAPYGYGPNNNGGYGYGPYNGGYPGYGNRGFPGGWGW